MLYGTCSSHEKLLFRCIHLGLLVLIFTFRLKIYLYTTLFNHHIWILTKFYAECQSFFIIWVGDSQ